jgi:endoglucanase
MAAELSGSLPWLATAGNRIVQLNTEQPILLRGINRSGLEYTEPSVNGFLDAAQLTQNEIGVIVTMWRSNIIRVSFNQDWALNGKNGHPAKEYLTALDQVISWASALGAYTILDLQWLDSDTVYGHTADGNGGQEDNHVAPTPNAATITLWNALATRYCDEPAVLFDLFNEPHDRLNDDPMPINIIGAGAQWFPQILIL